MNGSVYNRSVQDVAGFSLTFKDFRPHGVLRRHRSKRAGVCVVVGGGLSENAQGIHAFGTADAVFRPPAETHGNVADCTGARVVLVEASEARLLEFERSGLHVKQFVARRSPVAAGIGLRIGKELLSREASPFKARSGSKLSASGSCGFAPMQLPKHEPQFCRTRRAGNRYQHCRDIAATARPYSSVLASASCLTPTSKPHTDEPEN